MKYIKNAFWIILGWIMCLTTAVIGWFYRETNSAKINSPWTSGLIKNVLRAASKYDTKSWLMRCKGIWLNPDLTRQYLAILSHKSTTVVGPITMPRKVDDLIPSHDIDATSAFHRQRVVDLKAGKPPASKYGGAVVVNDTIHDGHHRIAACKEAGIKYVLVQQYLDLTNPLKPGDPNDPRDIS